MTNISHKWVTKEILDIGGPEGNAYFLLGRAQNLSTQLGLDTETILKEMKASDYDNLVKVYDKYFGKFFSCILP